MPNALRFSIFRKAAILSLVVSASLCGIVEISRPALAQNNDYYGGRTSAVGGVSIDAAGAVTRATVQDLSNLRQTIESSLQSANTELAAQSERRVVSLRGLESAIQKSLDSKQPLPEDVCCLAGLRRIEYVMVDTDNHDILLVGPAEGWRVDAKGNVVGLKSEAPVMWLDDMLTALRSQDTSKMIRCSIDPTPEGIQRLSAASQNFGAGMDPRATSKVMSEALGDQVVSVEGVPTTSHFARVLVAADFRMKSISLAFEPSPVRSLPSFLSMANVSHAAAAPRFWLEPTYAEVVRNDAGTVWKLNGASVKALSENDYVDANGQRQGTGKTDPVSQKWADRMTKAYPELAKAEPIFAELQNCMDFAVLAALLRQGELTKVAGYDFPILMGTEGTLATTEMVAPKTIPTGSNFVKRSRGTIFASGGVEMNPYRFLSEAKTDATLDEALQIAAAPERNWWWD